MAPEITGDQKYSNEVDTFALGLLFFAVYKLTVLTNSFNQKSLIPGIYVDGTKIAFLNEELKKNMPSEQGFVTSYFGDDVNIGKLVYSMLHQEPERRPEMEQVLVQMVEIKVEQKFKSMTIRQEQELRGELNRLTAEKNELQLEVQQWRKSASQGVHLFFLYNSLTLLVPI